MQSQTGVVMATKDQRTADLERRLYEVEEDIRALKYLLFQQISASDFALRGHAGRVKDGLEVIIENIQPVLPNLEVIRRLEALLPRLEALRGLHHRHEMEQPKDD